MFAVDCKVVIQVDGSAWKVSFQMHAGDVVSFAGGFHTEQLSGVLVCRRDILAPGPDLVRAAPGLALVDNDSVIGEKRGEGVEVAGCLRGEVAADDVWDWDSHDASFQQRGSRTSRAATATSAIPGNIAQAQAAHCWRAGRVSPGAVEPPPVPTFANGHPARGGVESSKSALA